MRVLEWRGSTSKIFARTLLVTVNIWISTSDLLAATPAEYTVKLWLRPMMIA